MTFHANGIGSLIVLLVGLGLGLGFIGAVIAGIVLLVRHTSARPPSPGAAQPPFAAPRPSVLDPAAALRPPTRPDALRPPPALDAVQAAFPELEIQALIGQGGMGAVYRVRRRSDDALYALKLVDVDGERGEAFAARFLREGEALSRLTHPNIVAVRGSGRSGRWCWLLMDLVDGANLRQVMATGALSAAQALKLVPPLCAALQYAHDQGVVHRDLKPENILIDQQGEPRLVDFGLAKLTEPDGAALTASGAVLGTVHYMAPEQIERARGVDHRADIYALGVVIYELLTGRLPLGRFEPPSHSAQVDVRVDDVVLRALERDPDRRWQRASQVGSAVRAIPTAPATALAPPSAATSDLDGVMAWGMPGKTFLVLLHLSVFAGYLIPFAGIVLPIVMWLTTRDRHPRFDANGRVVLNWMISAFLYGIVCVALCFVIIGIPLFIALAVCGIIFPIIGAARGGEGRTWVYPLSIPFLGSPERIVADAEAGERGSARSGGLGLGGCLVAAVVVAGVVLFVFFGLFMATSRSMAEPRIHINAGTPPAEAP